MQTAYVRMKNLERSQNGVSDFRRNRAIREWALVTGKHKGFLEYCIERADKLKVHVTPRQRYIIDHTIVKGLPMPTTADQRAIQRPLNLKRSWICEFRDDLLQKPSVRMEKRNAWD